ncbi:MAG: hypothetical protein EZS28_043955 [Streblomastix strix]|uniref:Uncharacterized protein n=1 Tax=Streblomastix strix TaxID=222440 RepID=A0A5J4TQH6_9EUKA|nr:MAG: hypothetical protein EZS28_043955 [Streblomastix strix]
MVTAMVHEAIMGMHISDISFKTTNISYEQNGEVGRREIQSLSQLLVTLVLQSDEVLDSKRSPIDKIWMSERILALYNFRIIKGILANLWEQQHEQLIIGILSQIIHKIGEAERKHFARLRNENGTNANYFRLGANIINSHLNSYPAQHLLGAHIIAKCDATNMDAMRITKLLFGIHQLGKRRVKTKKYHQPASTTIWKQIIRPIHNLNENLIQEQNYEIQIARAQPQDGSSNDSHPTNAGPRGQPPPRQ